MFSFLYKTTIQYLKTNAFIAFYKSVQLSNLQQHVINLPLTKNSNIFTPNNDRKKGYEYDVDVP